MFRYNIPIGIVNVRVGYFVLHQICNREAMRLPLFDWHLVGRQNVKGVAAYINSEDEGMNE